MIPELCLYLFDHSRSAKYLFMRLKSYVNKTTQANLRLFTDCDWDQATDTIKKRIQKRYSMSPKALVDSDFFRYEEFESRLNQFIDEISKTKTSYGVYEVRSNRL